jgi:hypothetical protein
VKRMELGRRRILRWRHRQPAYARMPEELWQEAVALARVDGAYAVARDLGVSYATLKRRLHAAGADRVQGTEAGFVEIDAAELLGGSAPATVLELCGDGTKLTVRMHGPLDVVALADAFLRRGR